MASVAVRYQVVGRQGLTQSASYTGTAGTVTNGASTGIYVVRVLCSSDAFVKIGDSPTATTYAASIRTTRPTTPYFMPADRILPPVRTSPRHICRKRSPRAM